jgi:drug/metabolite transporter (DMT)-like permease
MVSTSPIRRGVLLAMAAALLFGLTVPFVQRATVAAGPLSSGCLLYLGAALTSLVGFLVRRRSGSDSPAEPPLRGTSLRRLFAIALLGAGVAPTLLVMGLKRTDAATGALLLALEAPFTLVLARAIYRERLGWRVAAAAALIVIGGVLLGSGGVGNRALTEGSLLVGGAALAWALDNILSRRLADHDPVAVVIGKGFLGGSVSALLAFFLKDPWPALSNSAVLLLVGGLGYGVSLELYLRAQRLVGAARTASVFAAAPFLGAAAALALGAPWPGWTLPIAALFMGTGLWLHASERHGHVHVHEWTEHEHLHGHDDGHHSHVHEPMPQGTHSHRHRHEPVTHAHEHGEDPHHRHAH